VTFEALEQAMDAVITELLDKGVTADETQRAINSSLASAIYAQDSMGYVARIFGFGLMTGSTFEDIRTWPKRLARVTPEQVTDAARKYLDRRASVTGTLARDGARPRS
jgi:zinc protease